MQAINISTISRTINQRVAYKFVDQLSNDEEHQKCSMLESARNLENLANYFGSEIWEHKSPLSTNDELTTRYFPAALNSYAIQYFSQNIFQDDELDWFYVDALIANTNKNMVALGESLAGTQAAGAFTHGILQLIDGKYKMGLFLIIAKLFKLLVISIAVFFPLMIAESGQVQYAMLSLGAIGYVLMSWCRESVEFSVNKDRIFKRIWCLNRVYSLTSEDFRINWELLARELDATRREGVPWLSGLDYAVKARANK
jgi:hypothetical protein